MIFGALAGAREVLMIDAHGGMLRRSRSNLLLGAPARLSRETLTGASDIAQSRRELQRLEQEALRAKGVPIAILNRSNPRVVYLLSTPGRCESYQRRR
jgi:hypothetical protein